MEQKDLFDTKYIVKVKEKRKKASTPSYVSPNQLVLEGFETPFEQKLYKDNRWIKLSAIIPWDSIVNMYDSHMKRETGRPPISGRIIIGACIIKHTCDLTDRETISQIQENMYMQYFLGYTSYTAEPPFSPTLFVEIRERLNEGIIEKINEAVVEYALMENAPPKSEEEKKEEEKNNDENNDDENIENNTVPPAAIGQVQVKEEVINNSEMKVLKQIKNAERLILDATANPQNITYPTDLKVSSSARVKSEELIDSIYKISLHHKKPRTYREIANKLFKSAAKKKRKTSIELQQAIKEQLNYLIRNIRHIKNLLKSYDESPFTSIEEAYFETIQTVYEQQKGMLKNNVRSCTKRIVNIHQPHVRPIVRGKAGINTEFGSKMHNALVAGFILIDHFDWEAYNEETFLPLSLEKYKERFGKYPKEVLADQIYCNRANRKLMKELGIKLLSKPLGRPSEKAVEDRVSPGERNPIEGKYGELKVAYGLSKVKAKLLATSQSWISLAILVANLAHLARLVSYYINSTIDFLHILLIDNILDLKFQKMKMSWSF
jgi:transposase, IS5 family